MMEEHKLYGGGKASFLNELAEKEPTRPPLVQVCDEINKALDSLMDEYSSLENCLAPLSRYDFLERAEKAVQESDIVPRDSSISEIKGRLYEIKNRITLLETKMSVLKVKGLDL